MNTKYDQLSIIPWLVAETIANQVYTGSEISIKNRSQAFVDETEAKRKLMTAEQVKEFYTLADKRCRDAYEAKALWFMKIVRSKSDTGRDRLCSWMSHWLSSYLKDAKDFRRNCGIKGE